ncbi:MAG TPA: HxsD-like protein [Terriglobia bacterium]|nr:HxsD-like protein [Terriglobia bacterium]
MRFVLSHSIYPPTCLASAVSAYRDFCSVTLCESTGGASCIDIAPALPEYDELRTAREFLNYLLDISLEAHLGETGL